MKRDLETFKDIDNLPCQYQRRTCTDVFCIFIGIGFSAVLISAACILFNYAKFVQVNFPADSQGDLCGIDHNQYPYVYFVNPPQISRRVCVSECPKQGDTSLKCIPTSNSGCKFHDSPGFEVMYYDNQPSQTRSGKFCFPTDEALKKQLLQNSNLQGRDSFFNSLDTIIICFFIAFGVSFIYMLLVQCFPKIMNYLSVAVGSIVILVSAICVFAYETSFQITKLIIAISLLIVLLIVFLTVCKNTDSWKMHGIFLNYSTKLFVQRCSTFLYIPIFLIILVGFVVILVLQFTAYWSSGNVTFNAEQSVFHQIQGAGPIVFTILLVIQGIWGLSFIKQAFNFCVSGQAVNWYFEKDQGFFYAFKLLFCKHLGSVIGGSFMTSFLSLWDFIFDFIKPDQNANPDGCYTNCYKCFCCCAKIFDLVRSDAMGYINLTGNPYCNSARYCEYLCDRSIIMDYSQSTSRVYRICSHFLITGIMLIMALYMKGNISIYALLVIMIQSLFIATLFISVHADATQAIQIIFLADEEFVHQKKQDQATYQRGNLDNNLQGFKRRQDLLEQVKKERENQQKLRQQQE